MLNYSSSSYPYMSVDGRLRRIDRDSLSIFKVFLCKVSLLQWHRMSGEQDYPVMLSEMTHVFYHIQVEPKVFEQSERLVENGIVLHSGVLKRTIVEVLQKRNSVLLCS